MTSRERTSNRVQRHSSATVPAVSVCSPKVPTCSLDKYTAKAVFSGLRGRSSVVERQLPKHIILGSSWPNNILKLRRFNKADNAAAVVVQCHSSVPRILHQQLMPHPERVMSRFATGAGASGGPRFAMRCNINQRQSSKVPHG